MGSIQCIGQILNMQADAEAWVKFPSHHKWRLRVQNSASCQPSPNRLVDKLRLYTCLGRKR
ncbi:hypothetical protein D3C81_1764100 [compost metagenome]